MSVYIKKSWWKILIVLLVVFGFYYLNQIKTSYGDPGSLVTCEEMIGKYGVSAYLTSDATQKEAQQIFTILKNLVENERTKPNKGVNANLVTLEHMKIISHKKGTIFVLMSVPSESIDSLFYQEISYLFEHTWLGRWKVIDSEFIPK